MNHFLLSALILMLSLLFAAIAGASGRRESLAWLQVWMTIMSVVFGLAFLMVFTAALSEVFHGGL